MGKSIILAKHEFDQKIVELVNESKLPAFVVRNTLTELMKVLAEMEKKQLEDAIAEDTAKKLEKVKDLAEAEKEGE